MTGLANLELNKKPNELAPGPAIVHVQIPKDSEGINYHLIYHLNWI